MNAAQWEARALEAERFLDELRDAIEHHYDEASLAREVIRQGGDVMTVRTYMPELWRANVELWAVLGLHV